MLDWQVLELQEVIKPGCFYQRLYFAQHDRHCLKVGFIQAYLTNLAQESLKNMYVFIMIGCYVAKGSLFYTLEHITVMNYFSGHYINACPLVRGN